MTEGKDKVKSTKRRSNRAYQHNVVIKYLNDIIQNLGINAINNIDDIPKEEWDYMFRKEKIVRDNVKEVAQDKQSRIERSRHESIQLKLSKMDINIHQKDLSSDHSKISKISSEMENEQQQPAKKLLKLNPPVNFLTTVEGTPSIFHDNIPYFNNLHSIPLYNNPELNSNVHKYLSKVANEHSKFMIDMNHQDQADTLKYIQQRRMTPNLPIDHTKDDMNPLHSNLTLFKLITPKNDNIKLKKIPPRIEAKLDFWKYIEKTILTISRKNSILFALDIEGFESNQNIITEIGISIFDPRENLPEFGLMTPILHNYHLIVSEYLTLRNKNFLSDLKDCYLLGESLILTYEQCTTFIQSLINFYMVPKTEEDKTWGRCFVGHGISNDLTWLTSMNVELPSKMKDISFRYQPSETLETAYIIDTSRFHQILYGDMYGSLGKLLKLYNIPHSYMHNAGNDAYYTLQLLLTIGNYKFRELHHLDDLKYMYQKIHMLQERDDIAMHKNDNSEVDSDMISPASKYKYNIPMTNIASVIEFIKMNSNSNSNSNNNKNKNGHSNRKDTDLRKKRENLLGITQFHGCRWVSNAGEGFNIVEDINLDTMPNEHEKRIE
ncbi:Gfd2p PWA37_002812 [Arxiozyma heterogenica]|uniref:Gfd2/YDR514C-like C-terminal domain-containing protein n=1 Tax=Arxiozyma heterogenica TaxID=278026 RepID=A0AAN7WQG6_9SACH|nr:hypothetical protein RI543_003524 [Kazachstania heterogenica]